MGGVTGLVIGLGGRDYRFSGGITWMTLQV